MTGSEVRAARYNIRALLPGPESALRDALNGLGAATGSLALLARYAAVEAIAIDGLRHDETRVIERLMAPDGVALSNPSGDSVVILGPLITVGELPARLRAWGQATEPLADALAEVLTGRGITRPTLELSSATLAIGERTLIIARHGPADIRDAAGAARPWVIDGESDVRRAIDSGADMIRLGVASVAAFWPLLAATPAAITLVGRRDIAISDCCAELRHALAEAAAAGVARRRILVEVAVGTADSSATATLQRLGQLRGLGVAIVADVTAAAAAAAPAIAAVARLYGADAVRCIDADPVRAALDVADAMRAISG